MNRSERISNKIDYIILEAKRVPKAVEMLIKFASAFATLSDKSKRVIVNGKNQILDDFQQFSKKLIKKKYKKLDKAKLDLNVMLKETNLEYSKQRILTHTINSKNELWFELFNTIISKGDMPITSTELWRELQTAIDFIFGASTFITNAKRLNIQLPRFF